MAIRKKGNGNGNGRRLATQQSVDQAVKSICDIMRRGNCAGAMQYVPELTWILFLRILDEKEHREEQEAEALGVPFRPSLEAPFRWRDWAAPPESLPEGRTNKRVELQNSPQNAFFNFVNTELLPHLKGLKNRPDAAPRQKVISEIMTGVERVRIDEMSDVLIRRVETIHEFYQNLCPEEIDGIFVSDFIKDDGNREYESLWFFSKTYIMEAKSFISKDNFDMTPMHKNVTYWNIEKQDYDFAKATEKSRVNLQINFRHPIHGLLKASRENCDILKEVLLKRIVPNTNL